MIRRWSDLRRYAAAVLLAVTVACALVEAWAKLREAGGIDQLSASFSDQSGDGFMLSRSRRYAGVREALAELKLKQIGIFVGGTNPWPGERLMAQSLLAPTLVVNSTDQPVVLVCFEPGDEAEFELYLARTEMRVVRRFGTGTALLARRETP